MELGERGNSRTVPGVPGTPRSGCTVLRGVGGTCPWSGFHLRRPLRPSPMARMCARLFHKKDHRGGPLCEPEQTTRGLETPAGCPPNGPPLVYPPVIALGAFSGPANAALAITRDFVVKRKRGLGVGKGDPRWVSFPPENMRKHAIHGRGGSGKSSQAPIGASDISDGYVLLNYKQTPTWGLLLLICHLHVPPARAICRLLLTCQNRTAAIKGSGKGKRDNQDGRAR